MFRLLDILKRIWILGSPHWITDLDPDPALLVSTVAFKVITKNNFFCLLLIIGTFTSVFKDNKSIRSHKTCNDGSRSWRPKNLQVRILKTGYYNYNYQQASSPSGLFSSPSSWPLWLPAWLRPWIQSSRQSFSQSLPPRFSCERFFWVPAQTRKFLIYDTFAHDKGGFLEILEQHTCAPTLFSILVRRSRVLIAMSLRRASSSPTSV